MREFLARITRGKALSTSCWMLERKRWHPTLPLS
jgi:hypothetical protein